MARLKRQKKYKTRGGVTKSCKCQKWSGCKHPWYGSFYLKRCGCKTPACPPDVRSEHARTNRVRISLHKFADKRLDEEMSKTEADGWMDKLRNQIRDGTFGAPDHAATQDSRLTLADVADLYFEQEVKRPGRRQRPIKAVANYLRIL